MEYLSHMVIFFKRVFVEVELGEKDFAFFWLLIIVPEMVSLGITKYEDTRGVAIGSQYFENVVEYEYNFRLIPVYIIVSFFLFGFLDYLSGGWLIGAIAIGSFSYPAACINGGIKIFLMTLFFLIHKQHLLPLIIN